MSSDRRPPAKQLDMPLVWELEPMPDEPPGNEGPFQAPAPAVRRVSFGRLALAAAADLGGLLVAVALACAIVAATGSALDPVQLSLAALVGAEVAAVVAVVSLWAWRGTLGMLLLATRLDRPIALGRAARLSLWWLACLPLVGVPLAVGRSGGRGIERLAGVGISFQPPPSAA